MDDLSDAVQWWDASQLRFLVLASLGVQYFLTFFAGGRKFSVPSWFRFAIWLSYLGSDALAIYALATLFNRRDKLPSSNGSRDLEVLWAPFLLMHLGGQIFISAYNIEDNELWTRHIVTALSQVAVALYVFCKSWSFSADSKLLATAILIFIPGILKCFAKPWGLKYASFHSLADSLDLAERTTVANREDELQKYVQEARTCVLANDNPSSESNLAKLYVPKMLFVDFAYTYSHRLTNLQSFYGLTDKKAYCALRDGLSNIFDLLYTKKNMNDYDNPDLRGRDFGGLFTWFLSLLLPIVAIVLFHISHKKAYRIDDIAITGVLLYSTFVLEFCSIGILGLFESEWPNIVSQRSILGQFAHNKRHDKLMSLAKFLRCKDLLDQHWSMDSCHSAKKITKLVRMHIQEGWKDYIKDAESYREFNDIRGQWTLERVGCHGRLNWSLEKPFDESVIIWHIATDLCFHHMGASLASRHTCREMSNYMMHLLVANPEMLMPGSRRSLFATAYNELEAILKVGVEDTLMNEGKIAKQLIDKVKSARDTITKESFIYDAWVLAEGLMDLGGEKTWKVIQGVWLEMMCFSAGRCRGFLHAKALGTGGEYLSYVWLALAHSGMETFPERLQRTKKLPFLLEKRKDLQTGGQDVVDPSANSKSTEEEITAPPSASQGDRAMEIVISS